MCARASRGKPGRPGERGILIARILRVAAPLPAGLYGARGARPFTTREEQRRIWREAGGSRRARACELRARNHRSLVVSVGIKALDRRFHPPLGLCGGFPPRAPRLRRSPTDPTRGGRAGPQECTPKPPPPPQRRRARPPPPAAPRSPARPSTRRRATLPARRPLRAPRRGQEHRTPLTRGPASRDTLRIPRRRLSPHRPVPPDPPPWRESV